MGHSSPSLWESSPGKLLPEDPWSAWLKVSWIYTMLRFSLPPSIPSLTFFRGQNATCYVSSTLGVPRLLSWLTI